jgi:CHASE2 domain-containing sensor protein
MRNKTFDFMVKSRVLVPKADQDIVIVDVNEASLAAMAKEYGRWPWPRQVFGEFVQNIQEQNPKAIVFDVLFSDADIYNPDSDAYFIDVIAGTENTYFPILRLPEANDKLSKLKPSMIPGLQKISGSKQDDSDTIALVLPHFEAVLNSTRLGTHNIDPDKDGIVREYSLWKDEHGWLLPSLPLKVFTGISKQNLETLHETPQSVLINWRGKPFTYQYVSFSDVMQDMGSKDKQRPQDEFKNKIVIIGSTAPSLLDIKATAMAKAYPGVEILATAIDNLKHDDYLHVWRGTLPYVLMSLMLIWATAFGFYKNMERENIITIFSTSQIGLLAISYIGINITNTYIDLAGPVTWAIACFSIAKIYSVATDNALQRFLAFDFNQDKQGTNVLIMPIAIESKIPLDETILKKIIKQINAAANGASQVESIKGTQSGIWGLFSDMIVVIWTFKEALHESKLNAETKAAQDAEQLALQLNGMLRRVGLPSSVHVRYAVHAGKLNNQQSLGSQWRSLFAQAVLKLEHLEMIT